MLPPRVQASDAVNREVNDGAMLVVSETGHAQVTATLSVVENENPDEERASMSGGVETERENVSVLENAIGGAIVNGAATVSGAEIVNGEAIVNDAAIVSDRGLKQVRI